jgi:hypothetical protein
MPRWPGLKQSIGSDRFPNCSRRRRGRWSKKSLCAPALVLATLCCLGSCPAQLCTTTHTSDLYCLIPTAFHVPATPFDALFTPFGTELSQLPTAKPSGAVLRFEHGQLVPTNESLGAIFSERAETLGRHRTFVGFAYQNFTMGTIDGIGLGNFPVVLYYPYGGGVYTVTQNRLDIRAGQYTVVGAFGVTDRVDATLYLPFERIAMGATVNGMEYGPGNSTATFNEFLGGHSGGIADVVMGAKGKILERKGIRLAAGVDVRLPTGNELNFLGAGTPGVRPYIAVSLRGRVSPHLNVGYQWNGDSILNASETGGKQRLPTDFFYAAGVNIEASKRWTVVADLLGRHFFDAPRLTGPTAISNPAFGTAMSIEPSPNSSYTTTDLALGFKARTIKNLILTGNVTIQCNDGGLRARAVPLVGLSYSF